MKELVQQALDELVQQTVEKMPKTIHKTKELDVGDKPLKDIIKIVDEHPTITRDSYVEVGYDEFDNPKAVIEYVIKIPTTKEYKDETLKRKFSLYSYRDIAKKLEQNGYVRTYLTRSKSPKTNPNYFYKKYIEGDLDDIVEYLNTKFKKNDI